MSQAQTNVLPIGGKYRPMYRMKPTDRWCLVTSEGKPVECDTATKAHRAARDVIDAIERPVHLIEEEPQPLGNVDDWRRQRTDKQVVERERVFGGPPSTIFLKGGRQVRVETKGRARA